MCEPILAFPKLHDPYVVEVDASDYAAAGVLSQTGDDNVLHPIPHLAPHVAPHIAPHVAPHKAPHVTTHVTIQVSMKYFDTIVNSTLFCGFSKT